MEITRRRPILLVDDPLLDGPLGVLARDQSGLLSVHQVRSHGVSRGVMRHRIRTGRWRRPTWDVVDVGVLRPAELAHDPRTRRAATLGLLAFGPDAVAVGLSALVIHGVWGVPLSTPPQVTKPDASGRLERDGIVCRRFQPGVEIVVVEGLRCVSPILALAQAVTEVDPRTALGLLDSALHRGVITQADLESVRRLTRGRRGCRRLEPVWAMVDGRRESPLESWAFFDLVEAGLTPTDVQVEMGDSGGRVVARADLGFELDDGTWLLVELDGRETHLEVVLDDERDNALVLAATEFAEPGTAVLRYRARHLGPRGLMVGQVSRMLAGRRWRRAAPVADERALLVVGAH